ncbi:MAG: head GIN domain-containing protein [Bacteroidota bacterium]
MKQMKFLFALVLGGSLLLTGCFIDVNDDDGLFGCIDADGPVTTLELDLAPFDGIELAMDAQVEITQGPEQAVTVEGKSDIFDELDLDINNGVWTIRTVDCVRDVDDLTFFITVPDLREVKISGSGEVESTNVFEVGDIELRISGSGEMDFALLADDVEVDISGSGKVFLEGEADELDLNISGSGDLRAFNLIANEGDINITGSGDAEVFINNRLDVRITGSGDVFYKGNPTIDVSITGSGEVIDAN